MVPAIHVPKIHCYDDGLKIPLIMRFPDRYQHLAPGLPGSAIDDLVMLMDLGPTTLRIAGIPIPEHFQGRVLCNPDKEEAREFVCSARDRLDNNPEVIRTIRTKRFRYIRNFLPHQPYASFYPDGGFFSEIPAEGTPEREFWETSCLPGDQKLHDPDGVFLMLGPPVMVNQNGLPEACNQYLFWQDHKPPEELYDVENDPEEISNLAGDPAFSDVRDELRRKLYGWMIESRDLGLIDEPEIVSRAAAYRGISHEVGVHCGNFERILETADLARLGEDGKNELHARSIGHRRDALKIRGSWGRAPIALEGTHRFCGGARSFTTVEMFFFFFTAIFSTNERFPASRYTGMFISASGL